jgi:histidinol phosphatase-like PHP family hydrolase
MSDADSIVAAAATAGVNAIALTEHGQHLQELRDAIPYLATRWSPEGPPVSMREYIGVVRAAAQRAEVGVLIGVELDARPRHDRYEAAVARFVRQHDDVWDVVIGSVHVLSDDMGVEETPSAPAAEAWDDYVDLQTRALSSGRYDVLAHPTRLGFSVPETPTDIVELLDRITSAASVHRVAVEINGNDYGRRPDLVGLLVASAARHGAVVSLGSDAHVPATAGCVIGVLPLLHAHGIHSTACFTNRRPFLEPLPSA